MDGSASLPSLDESFPRRYEVVTTSPIETPEALLYFPARPVLAIEVKPAGGKLWKGAFGADDFDHYLTGLYTTPADRTLCVVCGGAGYFVRTDDPERLWITVDCCPIRIVHSFAKHGLIVFGNFTNFVAYRFDERLDLDVAWRSARLRYDDLEVLRTSEDRIEGRAWRAPDDQMVGYSVEVATGLHEGGAYD